VKQHFRFAVMQAACSLSGGCSAVGRGAHAQDQTCKLQIVVALAGCAATTMQRVASPSLSSILIGIVFSHPPQWQTSIRPNARQGARSQPPPARISIQSAPGRPRQHAHWVRAVAEALLDALPASIAPRGRGGQRTEALASLPHTCPAIRHSPPSTMPIERTIQIHRAPLCSTVAGSLSAGQSLCQGTLSFSDVRSPLRADLHIPASLTCCNIGGLS